MRRLLSLSFAAGIAALAVGLAGCGSSGTKAAPASAVTAPSSPPAASTATSGTGAPGALRAEANATAAGDIPDNQIFLRFANQVAGYSMKYPEGWAQRGNGAKVTFRDKNNVVRIFVASGTPPTAARIRSELRSLAGAHLRSDPQQITVSGAPAFKVVYATESAPNAVTGKRVTLVVDRYYLSHSGKEAVVDLGTPEGVDNVDAYRLMIESFRWR